LGILEAHNLGGAFQPLEALPHSNVFLGGKIQQKVALFLNSFLNKCVPFSKMVKRKKEMDKKEN
jgi:hypothetical protein